MSPDSKHSAAPAQGDAPANTPDRAAPWPGIDAGPQGHPPDSGQQSSRESSQQSDDGSAHSNDLDSDLGSNSNANDDSTIDATEKSRHIRSFVRRAGRTTYGQARALAVHGPRFLLPYQTTPLDLQAAFGRDAPKVLEIGFGMGEATTRIAATLPEVDFIGCEVHVPGVGSLLRLIGEEGLQNVRIVQHDAIEVLRHMIAADALAGVHLYFPDPWHKVRHNKRRIVQPWFCDLAASRVAAGGYLHCATDWQPYAEHMLEVLSVHPMWENTADGFAPKPHYRPLTKFEQRGLRLGHGVWDVVFRRR